MPRKRSPTSGRPAPDKVRPDPELIVLARPEAGIRARSEGIAAAAADTTPLENTLKAANATLRPLFGVSEDRLKYETLELTGVMDVPIPDLSVYYKVESPTQELDALAGRLLELDIVEAAYVKPPAELAEINDMAPSAEEPPVNTPDFTPRQGYLDPAPEGIDARYAWTVGGGQGAGVSIIDIEGEWRFSHEDLLLNQGGVIGGTSPNDLDWRNHGTAVAGEFGGDRNTLGITGICPLANVRAISIFGSGSSSAAAIRQAANALAPGDIILIELHRPGPNATGVGQQGYIAMEWWPDDFDAIFYATARGVIVVEAAGNGAQNLDDPVYNNPARGFPSSWRNPFNRANRDSGAILAGAGAPPPGTHGRNVWGPDRSRLDFSNYGAAVDAQGWGREVTTCGYGDLQGGANEDQWYTDQFSGTSSASPIVVGALGCLQGALRAQGKPALTPAQARQILRTTGSPQQDAPGRPATQRVGNRPNLRQMLTPPKQLKEKREKIEVKESKLELKEKREKSERKELIKGEAKEKREKIEVKEWKAELKDGKPEKEFKERKPEVEGKGFREIRDFRRFRGSMSGGPGSESAGIVEERLDELESVVQQLVHFITEDMRPDLTEGALIHEPDLVALSEELERQASDAKQAKDAKDVEKMSER